jgi:CRISPR-associated protein Csx10
MKLTMHIRMCSDWHIGTGTGRHGGIDRLIARDSAGLPYVPASTMRNLWRDAAEMLARGLDERDGGKWTELVRQLFGSQPSSTDRDAEEAPVSSLVTMGDAAIAPGLRARLQRTAGGAWLREALTYVKPGVAIDTDTGSARDDHLRLEEAAVGGILLVAEAEVAPDAEVAATDADTIYWFLCGACCLIERLGGKRRRGLGACEVLLVRGPALGAPLPALSALSEQAAARLDKAFVPAIVQRQNGRALTGGTVRVVEASGGDTVGWHRLPIAITLRSPLIVPDEIQGNVITTLEYVPGSMLLPVVTSAARRGRLHDVDERIAQSDLRVLPATIELSGERGLPVPLAWGKPKDAQPKNVVEVKSGILEQRQRDQQIKSLRRGYIAPASGSSVWFRENVETTLRTHNVVDDERQTPTEDVGGVFSYEAIAAGQRFRSLVLLRGTATEADALRAELTRGPEHIERMGRAKQVGYGRVSITPADDEPSIEKRARCALNGFLIVWLETDALLPSPDLSSAPSLEALADAIARALYPDGTKGGHDVFALAPRGVAAEPGTRSIGILRTRRLQTWQTQWGLPRPSLTVLQAGSVAKLRLQDGVTITEGQRQTLEREGIGERRAEGLGVVRVNDATVTETRYLTTGEPDSSVSNIGAPLPDLTEEETTLLDAISVRAWKRRIIARAEGVMSQPAMRAEYLSFTPNGSSPTMSQLGALRSRLPTEGADNASDILAWIDRQRKKTRDRSPQGETGWLRRVEHIASQEAQQRDRIWDVLKLPADMPTPPGGTIDSMRQKVWAFAVTNTLLIAMRHHKRAGENAKASGSDIVTTSTQGAAP